MPNWTAILKDGGVIGDEPFCGRPFVCNYNGFPDECDVVFIGECPKNSLGDWRELWDYNLGFKYDAFIKCYRQRVAKTSKTREFYSCLRKNFGCKSIETNVCCCSSHRHGSNRLRYYCFCNRDVLNVLLKNLPQEKRIGIVPHGNPAREFIETFSVPETWEVIFPPVKQIGWASKHERERVEEFCEDIVSGVSF
ncbi:MAG: hypothetical protein OXP71_16365 [Candidatus Poribacteria bacterium]|nr:hypothetical protein [Candidatus Poribacteria bacterium]